MIQKNFKAPKSILNKFEVERENLRLFGELYGVKPTMSISMPLNCYHLKTNKKRQQMQEGI